MVTTPTSPVISRHVREGFRKGKREGPGELGVRAWGVGAVAAADASVDAVIDHVPALTVATVLVLLVLVMIAIIPSVCFLPDDSCSYMSIELLFLFCLPLLLRCLLQDAEFVRKQ